MEIFTSSEGKKVEVAPGTVVTEFALPKDQIGAAKALVDKRYPPVGFAINRVSVEVVLISGGSGRIVTPNGELPLSTGDIVYIGTNDPFAWDPDSEGLDLFMVTAPKFNSLQHKIVDE